jgi:CRISPR-associated protein Csb2
MASVLIHVRFHDGRYHGIGDWPPSPARLFQALVAGAGSSGPLEQHDRDALEWLEALSAPVIGAPRKRDGQRVTMFVPGNDLDKYGGDPRRVGQTRDRKTVKPLLFDADVPFFYVWTFESTKQNRSKASEICVLSERLYQLGRGVDLAWAWGELTDREALDELYARYPGDIHRPSQAGGGATLACPVAGSLDSLQARYAAASGRFATRSRVAGARRTFSQPPTSRFAPVSYNTPPKQYLYDLSQRSRPSHLASWQPTRVVELVTSLRDAAADRLRPFSPSTTGEVDRVLVGRKPDGTNDGPSSARVRILPLPSIGHAHIDRGIRRVLVQVPADCPIHSEDVEWAFSGLNMTDRDTGELMDFVLTSNPSVASNKMVAHYGIGTIGSPRWRTITPAALPLAANGRRSKTVRSPLNGGERRHKTGHVAHAVAQALRHAGVRHRLASLVVQREPFESRGARAEEFAAGTRFTPSRLWHVELVFAEHVTGPLVIGDGRFLGLGLMAPAPYTETAVNGHASSRRKVRGDALQRTATHMTASLTASAQQRSPKADRAGEQPQPGQLPLHRAHGPTLALLHLQGDARPALHEAVTVCTVLRSALQRKFDRDSTGTWSPTFSGHAETGRRLDQHRHAHYLALPGTDRSRIDRLLVWAPDGLDPDEVASLAAVRKLWTRDLDEPLTVALGVLGDDHSLDLDEPLGPNDRWRSLTPFAPTRHPKRRNGTIVDSLSDQVRRELAFRDTKLAEMLIEVVEQPSECWLQFRRVRPRVSQLEAPSVTGVELHFAEPVRGPVALGALSHFGLGLFTPV